MSQQPPSQLELKQNSLLISQQTEKVDELNSTVYSYLELESTQQQPKHLDEQHPIVKSLLSTKQQLRIEKQKTKK